MFGFDRLSTVPAVRMSVMARLRQIIFTSFGGYQPSRNYMRGPGPACRATETKINDIDASHAS